MAAYISVRIAAPETSCGEVWPGDSLKYRDGIKYVLRAVQAAARLAQPDIAQIDDVGADGDENQFIAIEFVARPTLSSYRQSTPSIRYLLSFVMRLMRSTARASEVSPNEIESRRTSSSTQSS